jgi:hypothetical protein
MEREIRGFAGGNDLDCRVASLLAMTSEGRAAPGEAVIPPFCHCEDEKSAAIPRHCESEKSAAIPPPRHCEGRRPVAIQIVPFGEAANFPARDI